METTPGSAIGMTTLLDNRFASAIFAQSQVTQVTGNAAFPNQRTQGDRVSSFASFRKFTAAIGLAFLTMISCARAFAAPIPVLPSGQLSVTDVQTIIAQAVTQAAHDKAPVVIAVTDREGNLLGLFDMTNAPPTSADDELLIFSLPGPPTPQQVAIQKARTAAYLSSDQNAFSTRTANQITGKHFPLGIDNAGPGPLFGLPMSSLPCGDIQKNGSGLTGRFGGIPLYINGAIAGGIGIDGARTGKNAENQNEDEVIALAGTRGIYHVPAGITADKLLVNGFRFQWIGSRQPNNLTPLSFATVIATEGSLDTNTPAVCGAPPPAAAVVCATPPLPFPTVTEAGVPGEWRV
ncbi:MAG TPA: heme-binding protein, partial [Candidatus Binataceae bacterium]|nr:heme-binding protein [Candidatus Binataceae bacterium]